MSFKSVYIGGGPLQKIGQKISNILGNNNQNLKKNYLDGQQRLYAVTVETEKQKRLLKSKIEELNKKQQIAKEEKAKALSEIKDRDEKNKLREDYNKIIEQTQKDKKIVEADRKVINEYISRLKYAEDRLKNFEKEMNDRENNRIKKESKEKKERADYKNKRRKEKAEIEKAKDKIIRDEFEKIYKLEQDKIRKANEKSKKDYQEKKVRRENKKRIRDKELQDIDNKSKGLDKKWLEKENERIRIEKEKERRQKQQKDVNRVKKDKIKKQELDEYNAYKKKVQYRLNKDKGSVEGKIQNINAQRKQEKIEKEKRREQKARKKEAEEAQKAKEKEQRREQKAKDKEAQDKEKAQNYKRDKGSIEARIAKKIKDDEEKEAIKDNQLKDIRDKYNKSIESLREKVESIDNKMKDSDESINKLITNIQDLNGKNQEIFDWMDKTNETISNIKSDNANQAIIPAQVRDSVRPPRPARKSSSSSDDNPPRQPKKQPGRVAKKTATRRKPPVKTAKTSQGDYGGIGSSLSDDYGLGRLYGDDNPPRQPKKQTRLVPSEFGSYKDCLTGDDSECDTGEYCHRGRKKCMSLSSDEKKKQQTRSKRDAKYRLGDPSRLYLGGESSGDDPLRNRGEAPFAKRLRSMFNASDDDFVGDDNYRGQRDGESDGAYNQRRKLLKPPPRSRSDPNFLLLEDRAPRSRVPEGRGQVDTVSSSSEKQSDRVRPSSNSRPTGLLRLMDRPVGRDPRPDSIDKNTEQNPDPRLDLLRPRFKRLKPPRRTVKGGSKIRKTKRKLNRY